MAEISSPGNGSSRKNAGARKSKKLSTRIDLTPMVDLGFLLITFFMYTTTMARPAAMELNMPVKTPERPNEVTASATMTILLSKDHRVYYYQGIGNDPVHPPELHTTGFEPAGGIRDAVIEKKKKVAKLHAEGLLSLKHAATFLIKPDDNSTYEDLVAILDEMSINDARVYAVVDITPQDKEFIALTEAVNNLQ